MRFSTAALTNKLVRKFKVCFLLTSGLLRSIWKSGSISTETVLVKSFVNLTSGTPFQRPPPVTECRICLEYGYPWLQVPSKCYPPKCASPPRTVALTPGTLTFPLLSVLLPTGYPNPSDCHLPKSPEITLQLLWSFLTGPRPPKTQQPEEPL